MVKKALNLQELIDLQKPLEKVIGDLQYRIIINNPGTKASKEEEKVNVPELYELLNKAYDQLTIIKLAKHNANSKKSKLGVSNQELIFERSNLLKKQSLLATLFESKQKARKGGKANVYEFQLDKASIETDLTEVETRLTNISNAMTDFNTSHKVKIKLYEELELL